MIAAAAQAYEDALISEAAQHTAVGSSDGSLQVANSRKRSLEQAEQQELSTPIPDTPLENYKNEVLLSLGFSNSVRIPSRAKLCPFLEHAARMMPIRTVMPIPTKPHSCAGLKSYCSNIIDRLRGHFCGTFMIGKIK